MSSKAKKGMNIYDQGLVDYIRRQIDYIDHEADDGGGTAFAYQRILDVLHDVCDYKHDGIPSIVDENGGI